MNMKRSYKQPQVEVVKVELEQMIAESIGFGEGTKDPISSDSRIFEEDGFVDE